MNVELLTYTPDALELLVYTKNTRLGQGATLDYIKQEWTMERKLRELAYMRGTVQSSWEFVDYTFKISGVSRAFTHQLVRSRANSYAQESQRAVDVRHSKVINPTDNDEFERAANLTKLFYAELIDIQGLEPQDARGVLPTNIETSIIVKANLRSLHDMGLLRLCVRTQGEYQEVFKEMVNQVSAVHPWAEQFIRVHCVWYGTCAFPNYEGCPLKKDMWQPDDEYKDEILQKWSKLQFQAKVKA